MRRLLFVLFVLGFSGCAKEEVKTESVQATAPVDERTKVTQEFLVFAKQTFEDLKAASNKVVDDRDTDGNPMSYRNLVGDDFTYDIQTTDSLVSPYIATMQTEARISIVFCSDPILKRHFDSQPWKPLVMNFVYQDGAWKPATP